MFPERVSSPKTQLATWHASHGFLAYCALVDNERVYYKVIRILYVNKVRQVVK